ncbi:hypothetical protein LR48_Vigan233s002200 [Vigna angularis]|uniref:Ubiquitin-like protease family profile domain-containing protein n=1 Tax=Phaseolus angularis TaxID=3914 RepID=A0A0L9T6D5_PHAAN|nr:hypothetical protein LR48_Vigan233s002200 [Vigna angularis]
MEKPQLPLSGTQKLTGGPLRGKLAAEGKNRAHALTAKRYMDTVIVDQGWSSMYGFVEPQTIQPFGNTIESKQKYLETWMAESNRDIYFVPYIDGYMDTVIVDQGWSSMYGFVEPQTIQPFGNTIESKQKYLETWMAESNRDIYFVPYIDGSHWQLMLIIRAVITDDWNERFKSISTILEDAIKKIRQKWTAYLLQRWT